MKYQFCYLQAKHLDAAFGWRVYAMLRNGSDMQFLSCHRTESAAQREVERLQREGLSEVEQIVCHNRELEAAL